MATPAYVVITDKDGSVLTQDALTVESVGQVVMMDAGDESLASEDEAALHSFQYEVRAVKDSVTNVGTGVSKHRVNMTKYVDSATPLLLELISKGDSDVTVTVYQLRNAGASTTTTTGLERYNKYEFSGCRLVTQKIMKKNTLDANFTVYPDQEFLEFTYTSCVDSAEKAGTEETITVS